MGIMIPFCSIFWLYVINLNGLVHADAYQDASCFSFFHTDESNQDTYLGDTCFEISNETVNRRYTGIDVYIKAADIKNIFPCSSQDIQLETVQRYIVENKTSKRSLCRTKYTVSIKDKNCGENIKNIDYYCHYTKPNALFFQDCMSVDCSSIWAKGSYPHITDKIKEQIETNAIIMSGFSKPAVFEDKWGVYNIPTSYCNMRHCKLENWSIDEHKKIFNITSETSELPREENCLLFGVKIGGAGLLLGILSTSFACLLLNRCKMNHRNGEIMFYSKQNDNMLSETELDFAFCSKEGETMYHHISDSLSPLMVETIQGGAVIDTCDDTRQQRCSESPKSSSSAFTNVHVSSSLSVKHAEKRTSESIKSDRPQFYHTLSRDYKDNSSSQDFQPCRQNSSTESKKDSNL